MEIPLAARVTEFAANTSSIIIHHSFWKWGALVIALIYAFNCVVVKIFVLHLHRKTVDFSSSSAISGDDSDGFSSSDDQDSDSETDGESFSSEDDENDEPASISCDNLVGFRHDDGAAARKRKFKMRRKRSLGGSMFAFADLVNGSSVVKIWDGLGLGLGLDDSNSSVSIFDLERKFNLYSFPGQVSAVSETPSAVVFTASGGCDGGMGMSSWDVRVRRRTPAAKTEGPSESSSLRVKVAGVEKVYVRDDGTGKEKIWDLRKTKSPLTECDGEKWWECNAVSHTEEE